MKGTTALTDTTQRLLAAKLQLPPIPWTHARGSWVYCDEQRYLDAASGIINVNIGHAHPVVAEAMSDQVRVGTYASPGALAGTLMEQLARQVTLAVDRPDDRVMFSPGGTSGIEGAISLARLAHRARGEDSRHKILTASLGYHGNSAFMLALSGHRRRRPHPDDSFGLEPAFGAPYPGQHEDCPYETCRVECAEGVRAAIENAGPHTVAAVLIEAVNGTSGGGYVPPAGYVRAVREICAEYGVLVIHDEVLTGLGRTGLPLAAHHNPGGEADITVVSKGLAAGYIPLAATMIAPELAESILAGKRPLPIMGTMSATPLQARVGLAVLSVLDDIGALDRSQVRGAPFGKVIAEATRDLPVVTDVRGLGFYYGVELAPGSITDALSIVRDNGLLLYPFAGYRPDGSGEGLLVAPPLNVTEDELAFLGDALRAALVKLNELHTGKVAVG